MTYKLFVDDERFPAGDIAEWVICRTSKEAIKYVKKNGMPSFISFDHDLGGEDTAMKFVDWLVSELLNLDSPNVPFDYYVHSQNPIGAKNIKDKLDRLSLFLEHEARK